MQLKSLKTILKEKEKEVTFPDKKSVIIKGENKNQILYLVETLLSRDYTDYYAKVDSKYDFFYEPLSEQSVLIFTNGKIIGKKSTIRVQGEVPKIHCIRYVRDGVIRSFLCNDNMEACSLVNNMTRYSEQIDISVWDRLIRTVNEYLGFVFVELVDKDLRFHFTTDNLKEFTVEAQKLAYMLISECFITPENYLRILLLSEIECMTKEQILDLIKLLDNLKGHEMLLTVDEIETDDNVIGYILV